MPTNQTPPIIAGTPIKVGKTIINLDIAKLHTHTTLEIPVIIQRARKSGPVLLITAGIHGDEVNGVEIVRQIISSGINKPEKGMVICIPVVNVFGFINQRREFPDGRDLNRSFPGSAKGSLASRFAYHIMKEIIPHVDYCIDFHTGGASRFNYSQIRYNPKDAHCEELAIAFDTKFVLRSSIRDHSFRSVVTAAGKSVIMFEGGKALNLDKNVTISGKEGVIKVMHHLGMRNFSEEIAKMAERPRPIIITKSSWVRAKFSGMYRTYKSIGTKVKKGDKIGSISDPYGEFEKLVKAPCDGYIICSNHAPIVHQGDALFHITKANL